MYNDPNFSVYQTQTPLTAPFNEETPSKDEKMTSSRLFRAILLVLTVTGLCSCGPNDRLRDNYMGQGSSGDYRPVERDDLGNPILD